MQVLFSAIKCFCLQVSRQVCYADVSSAELCSTVNGGNIISTFESASFSQDVLLRRGFNEICYHFLSNLTESKAYLHYANPEYF